MKSRAGFIPRNERAADKANTITPWYKDWQAFMIGIFKFKANPIVTQSGAHKYQHTQTHQ